MADDTKYDKKRIMAFYAAITVVLAVVGYLLGRGSGKGMMYLAAGAVLGVVVSVILWVTWGKKNSA